LTQQSGRFASRCEEGGFRLKLVGTSKLDRESAVHLFEFASAQAHRTDGRIDDPHSTGVDTGEHHVVTFVRVQVNNRWKREPRESGVVCANTTGVEADGPSTLADPAHRGAGAVGTYDLTGLLDG